MTFANANSNKESNPPRRKSVEFSIDSISKFKAPQGTSILFSGNNSDALQSSNKHRRYKRRGSKSADMMFLSSNSSLTGNKEHLKMLQEMLESPISPLPRNNDRLTALNERLSRQMNASVGRLESLRGQKLAQYKSASSGSSLFSRAMKTANLKEELVSSSPPRQQASRRANICHQMAIKVVDNDVQWNRMKDVIRAQGACTNNYLSQNLSAVLKDSVKEMDTSGDLHDSSLKTPEDRKQNEPNDVSFASLASVTEPQKMDAGSEQKQAPSVFHHQAQQKQNISGLPSSPPTPEKATPNAKAA